MCPAALVTYYHHSGFSVAIDRRLFVFDYWTGRSGELPEAARITPAKLAGFSQVYVFVSHEHIDHFDPVIYEWHNIPGIHVTYVIADDMPASAAGRRMAPQETWEPEEDVKISAFGSTDLGVSFLVETQGVSFFHAGDLNFWHWAQESTAAEIDEAERAFHSEVAKLPAGKIDLAFFPVDPRQGEMFDAGANYFLMTVKPKILVPMHFWGRWDLIGSFARRSSGKNCAVVTLPSCGEQMSLRFHENGGIDVHLLTKEEPRLFRDRQEETPVVRDENDPFADTDLPVKLDD